MPSCSGFLLLAARLFPFNGKIASFFTTYPAPTMQLRPTNTVRNFIHATVGQRRAFAERKRNLYGLLASIQRSFLFELDAASAKVPARSAWLASDRLARSASTVLNNVSAASLSPARAG